MYFFTWTSFFYRVFLCPCIWRPKVIVICLPLVPSTLFIETWSLTELEPFWFHPFGCPANLKNPLLCLLNWDYWHAEKALSLGSNKALFTTPYKKKKSVPKLENLRTLVILTFLYILNTSLSSLRTSSMRPNCKAHFLPFEMQIGLSIIYVVMNSYRRLVTFISLS